MQGKKARLRIVGAQFIDGGEALSMPILNSSNPDDLQAQLANFLRMQEEQAKQQNSKDDGDGGDPGDDFAMPKINGRGIASNNRLHDPQANDKNGLRGKLKGKNGSSLDAEQDYVSSGFASIGSQLISNGQGVMLR